MAQARLDDELDTLYALPLSDFTAARDELAKRLRAADRRDEAEQVKQLRKPPVSVWLVNRLARERELDVQRLVKTGETLASSQAALAAGEGSNEFVEARQEEQRVLDRLAHAAREIAAREGVGDAAVPRATETLRAASLTEEGREQLKRGRLTEELQPPGFEALAGMPLAARPPKHRKVSEAAARKRALEQARERVRELRANERTLAAAAEAARREADVAEAKAAAAAGERETAEAELERLSSEPG